MTAPLTAALRTTWLGALPYEETWALQRKVHAAVAAGTSPDALLLVEHEGVFTAGKRTHPADRPLPLPSTPRVIDVDRGGRITWHGPGQLVGYPIVRLRDPIDVVAWVRTIEEVLIRTCADLGLTTGRVDGRSGVWVDGRRKVAAIGVRVAQDVTMHGFALNADCDLSVYDLIVPCGISDAAVTSLSVELGHAITVDECRAALAPHIGLLAQDGRGENS